MYKFTGCVWRDLEILLALDNQRGGINRFRQRKSLFPQANNVVDDSKGNGEILTEMSLDIWVIQIGPR